MKTEVGHVEQSDTCPCVLKRNDVDCAAPVLSVPGPFRIKLFALSELLRLASWVQKTLIGEEENEGKYPPVGG